MATDKRLSGLLDKFDQKVDDARKARVAKDKAEETFLQMFERHAQSVIKPTLIELGESLKARGHRYEIRERPFVRARDGKVQDAEISLEFFLKRDKDDAFREALSTVHSQNPHLSFSTSGATIVRVHESSMGGWGGGGHAGPAGTYSLEELTPELITDRFVALLNSIIGK